MESITPAVAPDGKVIATFNEVTVGISAVIFVEIYETDPADASQNLAYKGNSSAFTVQEGENNVEIELKKVAAPNQVDSVQFNPPTGPVDTGTTVTLSCDTPDATIYYTTDGSTPTTSSNRYTSTPITITTQTTIKAYAVKSGMTPSDVTERTYSLNQYTVQFVLNGGSFTESGKETSLSVQSGTEVVLKNYQVERAGYTFGGWYYDATFNTPVEDSGIVAPSKDNTTSGTLTLYAKWEVVNNSITSFADLKSAIENESETIHVAGNFEISGTLTISSATTIIADEATTFTRASGFTGALFTYNADFTLQGSSNAIITINGNNIEAVAPAIKTQSNTTSANLTVTYCNFENNTNTYSDGGAIFVETSATVNFSASNCNFTNNKVTRSNMAGGAVAINAADSTSTFDTCNFRTNTADQQGGGAVYIAANSSAYSEQWHNFINCEFANNSSNASSQTGNYGGAIYFARGSFSLNNIAMNNNIWTQDNSNSDIYADTTAVNLKLDGTVQINSLLVKSVPKNLAIADSFQTSSKIQISIDASSPTSLFKVLSYDKIGINNTETKSLSPEQIACFTSIVDSSGKQYTLNSDGTITAK